jgi:hypothetical protein
MNRTSLKLLRPMILVFILFTAFFVAGRGWLVKKGVDQDVVVVGNLVLFIISTLAFFITLRSLHSSNHHGFVRAMYGSFMVKIFAVAIAAFIYIIMAGDQLNKPAIFICMGLYLIYTFIEVSALLRVLKQNKNA